MFGHEGGGKLLDRHLEDGRGLFEQVRFAMVIGGYREIEPIGALSEKCGDVLATWSPFLTALRSASILPHFPDHYRY